MSNNKIFPYKIDASQHSSDIQYVACKNAAVVHIPLLDKLVEKEMKHPAKINGFVAIICTKGTVTLNIHMNDYTMQTGHMIVAPSSVISFKQCNNCELYIIGFTNEFAIDMNIELRMIMPLVSSLHSQCIMYKIEREDVLNDIPKSFRSLHEEFTAPHNNTGSNSDIFREYAVRHMFAAMVYRICQMVSNINSIETDVAPKDRSSDYFKQLISLLHDHYKTERSVEFYASQMNLTPKHLSRVVRNYSGKSVHQWIDEFVVLEIKNLLKFSDLSIQQISYELNFPNPSFMGQYFKRITGKTPGEYRKEM
ncbi:MAG: AraC family transcriptional regulator [Alistipes sp.]|nr:AraC family transcriptional regulator [Alistipes sp.]